MKNMGIVKTGRRKKSQYVIGCVIAVVIIFMWISLPMMSRSSLDSSVPYGSPFSRKSADLSLLADGSGMTAPGSLLSGELTDNPATSLDLAASSLFGSLDSGESAADSVASLDSSGSGNSSSSGGSSGSGGGSSGYAGAKGKLSVMPSMTSGNSNTSTVGSRHNKFFGSQNADASLVPMSANLDVKPKNQQASVLFNSLNKVKNQSVKAAAVKDHNEAKSMAATGFDGAIKAGPGDLTGGLENQSANSGLALASGVDTLLKKNDPNLNKKDNSLPSPTPEVDEEAEKESQDEQIKQMIMQMLIQMTVGQAFGAMGQMFASQIYPGYKKGDH